MKSHYGSHASNPMLPSNENGDYENMKALKLNCFVYYKQSDWSENAITCMFIHISQAATYQLREASERSDFDQIVSYPVHHLFLHISISFLL